MIMDNSAAKAPGYRTMHAVSPPLTWALSRWQHAIVTPGPLDHLGVYQMRIKAA
jgi:hypothetical protein